MVLYGIYRAIYLCVETFDPLLYVWYVIYCIVQITEEFEDTKGVIRIRISKKNRQHNDQKKKYKRTNNDLQNIHIKLKIEIHEPY
jgi:hypothetical protein